MEKINNILITGGAGFIGPNLVKRLVNEGYNLIVIDNLERGKIEFIQEYLDKITCEILISPFRVRGFLHM
jgi:nucleoside-diphosphate-sugar epimerase